jgi:hypothetical protein
MKQVLMAVLGLLFFTSSVSSQKLPSQPAPQADAASAELVTLKNSWTDFSDMWRGLPRGTQSPTTDCYSQHGDLTQC